MYLLPALTNGIQGFFRGIGDLKITLISSFINMALRVLAAAPFSIYMENGNRSTAIFLSGWLDRNAGCRNTITFKRLIRPGERKLGSRAGQSCRNADYMKGEKIRVRRKTIKGI